MQPLPPKPPAAASAETLADIRKQKKRSREEVIAKDALKKSEMAHLKYKYVGASHLKITRTLGENKYRFVTEKLDRGQMKKNDGTTYYGFFNGMSPNGHGILQTPQNEYYDGNWTNGVMEGPLTFHTRMGHKITGDWKDGGWVDGQARLEYKNGEDHYEGTFSDVQTREGKGRLETKTKTYIGMWEKDKFALGKIIFKDDPVFLEYDGQIRFGQFNGKGTLTLKDGRKIQGEFSDGICINGKATKEVDGKSVVVQEGRIDDYLISPKRKESPPPESVEKKKKSSKGKSSSEDTLSVGEIMWTMGPPEAPAAASRIQPAPPSQPAQRMNVPGPERLPGFSEFVAPIDRRSANYFDNDKVSYSGELQNGIPHGKGTLLYKTVADLKPLGIYAPVFTGIFVNGRPMTGAGLVETIFFDGSSRFSYGTFKDGHMITGVGFVPEPPHGTWVGFFQNGKLILGNFYPAQMLPPTTHEVFAVHMLEIRNLENLI